MWGFPLRAPPLGARSGAGSGQQSRWVHCTAIHACMPAQPRQKPPPRLPPPSLPLPLPSPSPPLRGAQVHKLLAGLLDLIERQEPAECAVETEEAVSPSGPAGPAGSAGTAGTASGESGDECKAVYRVYAKWGGADGAIGEGLTGTLTSGHMCAVLGALGVGPRTTFVDIGAADGRALVCAAMLGARRVVGYELPEPGKTHELVMNGARAILSTRGKLTDRFEYVKRDIREVGSLPEGTTAVYSFWDGFMPRDQEHVLRLMAACPTLQSACVFLKAKSWKREFMYATR